MFALLCLVVVSSVGIPGVSGEVLFDDKCRSYPALWSCSSCDLCPSMDECPYEDALYRSGYYCEGWPYMNRVPKPASQLFMPVEDKRMTCLEQNHTTCVRWEERKESSAELATTICTCESYSYAAGVRDYCESWGCEGIGIEKCGDRGGDCGPTVSVGLDITYQQDCCWTTCDDNNNCVDHQEPKRVHNEFQECQCIEMAVGEESTNGVTSYCQKWECIDYSRSLDNSREGYREYETHFCAVRSADGYCQKWDWKTDDEESWENTECNCVTTNTAGSDTGCMQYDCIEKGARKTYPLLAWMAFGIILGLAVFFAMWAIINDKAAAMDSSVVSCYGCWMARGDFECRSGDSLIIGRCAHAYVHHSCQSVCDYSCNQLH